MWVPCLGQEDPLEKERAPHSRILAGRVSWTEEPVRLQSIGSQRVGQERAYEHIYTWKIFNSGRSTLKKYTNPQVQYEFFSSSCPKLLRILTIPHIIVTKYHLSSKVIGNYGLASRKFVDLPILLMWNKLCKVIRTVSMWSIWRQP